MERTPSDAARQAYDAMAPIYDQFTASYEAEAWTGNLASRAEALGVSKGRLLDVGCGTGKSAAPMVDRGWDVVGCDISAAMLAVARERLGESVELAVADVRELPVFGEFDLVWAVNDTLNYVLSPAELSASLKGMRSNLAQGGVVVFDLNTLWTFRTGFAVEDTRTDGARTITWKGLASADLAPGSIGEARIEVSDGVVDGHVHRQRHFPEAEVIEQLNDAGLRCLEVWGELEGKLSQPLDEDRQTKAVYLAAVAAKP